MSQSADSMAAWLRSREPVWQKIASRVTRNRRGTQGLDELNEVVHGYRSLARDLAMSRKVSADGLVTRQLERLFLQTHQYIHTQPGGGLRGMMRVFKTEGPEILRKSWKSIAIATFLFVAMTIAGFMLTHFNPDTAGLFASPAMIEMVEQGELWTDDLLSVTPSSVISFEIITNNVAVTLFAFVLGAFYGLGTLYIIGLNGLMLGSIFAFTGAHAMAGRLFDFVVAHGVVELSVIAMAGGLGIGLGEALVQPGNRTRSQAFQQIVSDSGKVLILIVPYLIGAGIIEGFISPDPGFSRTTRIVVGVTYFAIMAAHIGFAGRQNRLGIPK